MTGPAWSGLVTGLGGALAFAIAWFDATVPGFSALRFSSAGDRPPRRAATGERRP